MKAYRIKDGKIGIVNVQPPQLKPGHVIVKNLIAGINHLDIASVNSEDFASGTKHLGFEGVAEVVEAHSSCNKKFKPQQRVCYATAFGSGAFGEMSLIHEDNLITLPNGIPIDYAATLFKALTAHMLLFKSYTLKKTDCIGVTSASGGVASYVVQWASHYGVKVIGMCNKQEHKQIASSNGCVSVFTEAEQAQFVAMAKKKSSTGLGLNVFYDSIGIKAYPLGIKALAPFGLYNHYGAMMGELKGMAAKHFQTKALFFTTPSTFYSKANNADLALSANLVFENMGSQILKPNIHRYKFSQLQKAFTDMQNGLDGQKVLVVE